MFLMKSHVYVAIASTVACVMTSVAEPSSATTSYRTTTVVEFVRTTDEPSHLAMHFTNGTDGSVSAAVGIWVLGGSTRLLESGLLVLPGGYLAPETNADGKIGCVLLPVRPVTLCESRVGGQLIVDLSIDTKGPRDARRVVLGFVGDSRLFSVALTSANRGWRMVRLQRRVGIKRTQDLAGTYAISASESVEHFTGASLPGGRFGSLAVAALPCRDFGLGLPTTGRGSAVLAGAPAPIPMGCPNGVSVAGALARGATTWVLHGDVYGTTSSGLQVTPRVNAVSYSPEDVRLMTVDGPV